jgi:hypothetical protein
VLKHVVSLGYSPVDKSHYATRYVLLEAPRWFRIEDVPRVREVDPGVSEIRFVVTLDPDQSLDAECVDGLSRHLWGSPGRPQPTGEQP